MIKPAAARLILAAGLLAAALGSPLPDSASFTTEFAYHLAANKAAYFWDDSYAYFTRAAEIDLATVGSPAGALPEIAPDSESENPPGLRALDSAFPFFRRDETSDVLGAYFQIDPATPPNFVIISVEGLGKAFSGPNAYLGSFTPFLDELAGKSLYWENFLAAQGRTFASLPSILASLPFAEKGFNALGEKMPAHHSLLSVLKHNGYRTKFACGIDLAFDNQGGFLRRQGVDLLVGIDDYDRSYAKSPGTSWGYADGELMRRALAIDAADSREPYLTFIQTMSMHTSYKVPDHARFLALFETHMDRLGFTESEKERHRAYKDIYATILYTDDALRTFFREYAKLPAYRNTIFLITGDHRLPEIPMSTKIDRYHVPLIISSPLLKHPARFESVSSHLDITPTLLAFLGRNYGLDVPSLVAWVGTGIDTEIAFRNVHSVPLKHTKTSLVDFLSGRYFLNQEKLFIVGRYMDLSPIRDEEKRSALMAEFDLYKAKNDRLVRELKLMPESAIAPYR